MNKKGVSKKNKSGRFGLCNVRVRPSAKLSAVCKKFVNGRINDVLGVISNDHENLIQYNTQLSVLYYDIKIDDTILYVAHEDYRPYNLPDNEISISTLRDDQLFYTNYTNISAKIDTYGNVTYSVDYEEVERKTFKNMTDEEKFQFSLICPHLDVLIKIEKCVDKIYDYKSRDEPTTILKLMKNF